MKPPIAEYIYWWYKWERAHRHLHEEKLQTKTQLYLTYISDPHAGWLSLSDLQRDIQIQKKKP